MGILDRLLRRKPPEQRDGGFPSFGGWSVSGAGYDYGAMSPLLAENLAAVSACVTLICNSLASLPVSLTVDDGAGRVPAPASATGWALLRRPSRFQSWPSMMQQIVGDLLLAGNSVSLIQTDGRGAITGLVPCPFQWLLPLAVETPDGYDLAFEMMMRTPMATALLGLPKRMLSDDVLFVTARQSFGILGQSAISRASAPVREGLEIQRLAEATWKNGARPSGVMSSPTYLTDSQRERFDGDWIQKFTGSINAGGTPLLEGGWKYETIALNSVDSEFLSTRKFSVSEVCRMFSIPEVLLQPGQGTVNDLAPFVAAFAQLCLTPIVTTIEAEWDHAILGDSNMHLSFDLDGLQRGSFSATVAAMAAMKQSGIITANDARGEMGFPPIEGGDKLATAAAPNWPADGKGMPHLGPSPGPIGAGGVAEPGSHHNQGAAS